MEAIIAEFITKPITVIITTFISGVISTFIAFKVTQILTNIDNRNKENIYKAVSDFFNNKTKMRHLLSDISGNPDLESEFQEFLINSLKKGEHLDEIGDKIYQLIRDKFIWMTSEDKNVKRLHGISPKPQPEMMDYIKELSKLMKKP